MALVRPSLTLERRLMRSGAGSVVGLDEVGRGSLAGPVSVGAVRVVPATPSAPTGLRDSKLLSADQRNQLHDRLVGWAAASAVGHAAPEEIDALGMTAALRLAAVRAMVQLGSGIEAIVLDGSYDWLGSTADGLPEFPGSHQVAVRVKADQHCSSVAAASVLAKIARDRIISDLAGPEDRYAWRSNKGYAAPEHLAALRSYGPTLLHRLSWQLPGVGLEALEALDPQRRRIWRRIADGEQMVLLPQGQQAVAGPG